MILTCSVDQARLANLDVWEIDSYDVPLLEDRVEIETFVGWMGLEIWSVVVVWPLIAGRGRGAPESETSVDG